MSKKPRRFSDQIRKAISDSEHTCYRISKETGLNESTLSQFLQRKRGLSLESLDKLASFLGLEVVVKKTKGK